MPKSSPKLLKLLTQSIYQVRLDNLLSLSPPVLQSLNIASLTHLAETLQKFSHDTINRYLRNEQLTPS